MHKIIIKGTDKMKGNATNEGKEEDNITAIVGEISQSGISLLTA